MVWKKACTCLVFFVSLWLTSAGDSVSRTFLFAKDGSVHQYMGGITDVSKSIKRDDDDVIVSQEEIESAEKDAMVGESSLKERARSVEDDAADSDVDEKKAEREAMAGEDGDKHEEKMEDVTEHQVAMEGEDGNRHEEKVEDGTEHQVAMDGEDGNKHEENMGDVTERQVEVEHEQNARSGDVTEKEIENAEQDALAKHTDSTVNEVKESEARVVAKSGNGQSEGVSVSEQEVGVAEAESTSKKASAEDVADQAQQDLEEAMSEEDRANAKEHGSTDDAASSGSGGKSRDRHVEDEDMNVRTGGKTKASEQVEQEEEEDGEQEVEDGSDAAAAKSKNSEADESQTEEDSEEESNNVPEIHHSSKQRAAEHETKESEGHSSKMRKTGTADVVITKHRKAVAVAYNRRHKDISRAKAGKNTIQRRTHTEHLVKPSHRKSVSRRSERPRVLKPDHVRKPIQASSDAEIVSGGAPPASVKFTHMRTVEGGPIGQVDRPSSSEQPLRRDEHERQIIIDGNDDVRLIPTPKLKKLLDALKTYKGLARKQALRIKTLESMVVETKQALRIEQLEVKLKEARAAKVKSTQAIPVSHSRNLRTNVDKVLVRSDVAQRSQPRDAVQNASRVLPAHTQNQSQKKTAQATVPEGVVKSLVGTKVERLSVNATEMPWSRDIVGVVVSDEDVEVAEKDALA